MGLTGAILIDYLRANTALNGDTRMDGALFSSGALDSVAMLDLICFVEDRAGIQIRADDVTLANFDTPARIVRFTEEATR